MLETMAHGHTFAHFLSKHVKRTTKKVTTSTQGFPHGGREEDEPVDMRTHVRNILWAVIMKVSCRGVVQMALTEWVLISPPRPILIAEPFGRWVVVHPDTSGEGYLHAASQDVSHMRSPVALPG